MLIMAHLPPPVQHALDVAFQAHLRFQDFMSSDHNLIPPMEWEAKIASVTPLSPDQVRFMLALMFSVVIGGGIRLFRGPTARHLYALLTGIALIYYPFGSAWIHIIPIGGIGYLLCAFAPRRAGTLAWATVFPYLIYMHVCNASGMAWKAGRMDFTGGAMVAVLKVLSVCMCRQDSFRRGKEELNPYIATHLLERVPGPLEYSSYLFSLGNLLSGPWMEFAEYKQFIELKGVWALTGASGASKPMPSFIGHGLLCLGQACGMMGMYVVLVAFGWGVNNLHSDWFYSHNWAYKCLAFDLAGKVYQLRYFFAWKLSEASFTFAGLNFLGWGEDGKAKWGRTQNAKLLGVWLTDSARMVPINWNIATGTFLRRYVYERSAVKGRKPGFRGLLFTQMVSALWHGLYPGYMMFFGFSAIWIYFSQVVYKAEQYLPAPVREGLPYRAVKITWTSIMLNYLASAFQLLTFKSSHAAFNSLHYAPIYFMVVVDVLFSFIKSKRPPRPAAAAGDGKGAGKGAGAKEGQQQAANGNGKKAD